MNFGTDNTYKRKSKVLEKVLNDEKLYTNKNVMYLLPKIIKNIRFNEQLEIANTVLSSENLFNNNEILAPITFNTILFFQQFLRLLFLCIS